MMNRRQGLNTTPEEWRDRQEDCDEFSGRGNSDNGGLNMQRAPGRHQDLNSYGSALTLQGRPEFTGMATNSTGGSTPMADHARRFRLVNNSFNGGTAISMTHANSSSDGRTRAPNQAAPNPTARACTTVPLRQWMKQVLQLLGDNSNSPAGKRAALSSPAYLEAAVRIALALADQLSKDGVLARDYGIFSSLLISSAHEWAAHVHVRLKGGEGDGTGRNALASISSQSHHHQAPGQQNLTEARTVSAQGGNSYRQPRASASPAEIHVGNNNHFSNNSNQLQAAARPQAAQQNIQAPRRISADQEGNCHPLPLFASQSNRLSHTDDRKPQAIIQGRRHSLDSFSVDENQELEEVEASNNLTDNDIGLQGNENEWLDQFTDVPFELRASIGATAGASVPCKNTETQVAQHGDTGCMNQRLDSFLASFQKKQPAKQTLDDSNQDESEGLLDYPGIDGSTSSTFNSRSSFPNITATELHAVSADSAGRRSTWNSRNFTSGNHFTGSVKLAAAASSDLSQGRRSFCNGPQPSQSQGLGHLQIGSAEIQCPSTNNKSNYQTKAAGTDESQRIFYLGLVLYELFSGGDLPPPTLHQLASSNGAFTSLSTMSLVKRANNEAAGYSANDNGDQNSSSADSKRQQGPAAGKGIGLCKLSCEFLRLIGVTGPLCHLIFNMLDCIHGDLGGKECYTKMSDVMVDLQLMLDKPSKFMYGLDTNNLSLLGEQLTQMEIPRDEQLECLKSCYHRCVSGTCDIAVIKGESGSGKSWLAQRIGNYVVEDGGLLLIGMFDQMGIKQPFSALASAFDQYCDLLLMAKGTSWEKFIVEKLKEALSQDACYLIMVIPKLGLVLEDDTYHNAAVIDMNCGNAEQRLHYLFCRFVEVITVNSKVSLTLVMDNVQWADDASIAVLTRLLMQRHKKFFFVACCREEEMEENDKFYTMLESVRAFGVNSTIISVNCFGENMLNTIVSDLLCLSPRLVRPLSDIIYSKTKGNPLFFSQLILSLHRDGLLQLDFDKQRWVWDEEKILSKKLPENVALCFISGIKKLHWSVQMALHTMSMFGASVKREYLELIESQMNVNLDEPLKKAVTEGLVIEQNGVYLFCHDRIQECSYNMVSGDVLRSSHLMYGRCLAEQAHASGDDDMLFLGVQQLNLAGPDAVIDPSEYISFAKLNLSAGKKAIVMSDFPSASTFFGHGSSFLRKNKHHWENHYEFSLDFFECSCQAALATGNIEVLHVLTREVVQNARSFNDKLNVHYIEMSSLAYSSQAAEALDMGLAVLTQLGEGFPSNPSKDSLDASIQATQSMLRGKSEDDLINHCMMRDQKQLMAMKFLARLQSIAFIVKPALHTFVITRMVQMTISYGLSRSSAFGFACFGSYLAKLGNIPAGHRFILLAKPLLTKLDAKESAGEVIAVITEVQCYVEPLLAANELRIQGEEASKSAGDFHWACLCRLQYCCDHFWAGTKLEVVHDKLSKAHQFIEQQQHKTILLFLSIMERTLNILLGKETEALLRDKMNVRQKMILSFHNLYLALLLNEGDVKECCEQFLKSELNSCFLMSSDPVQAFCTGLGAFQVYRETGDPKWLEEGRKRKEAMKKWTEQGTRWNFEHKLLIMLAEEHYAIGNFQSAIDTYEQARVCARSHKFINDEALACELAAKFYLKTGDLFTSMKHFRFAHEKYHQWGAVGKAAKLFQYVNENFANVLGIGSSPMPAMDSSV